MVFRKETPNPQNTLIRTKKVNAKWYLDMTFHKHSRHHPQTFLSSNARIPIEQHGENHSADSSKSILMNPILQKKRQEASLFVIRKDNLTKRQHSTWDYHQLLQQRQYLLETTLKSQLKYGLLVHSIHIDRNNKILVQTFQGYMRALWEI